MLIMGIIFSFNMHLNLKLMITSTLINCYIKYLLRGNGLDLVSNKVFLFFAIFTIIILKDFILSFKNKSIID